MQQMLILRQKLHSIIVDYYLMHGKRASTVGRGLGQRPLQKVALSLNAKKMKTYANR